MLKRYIDLIMNNVVGIVDTPLCELLDYVRDVFIIHNAFRKKMLKEMKDKS